MFTIGAHPWTLGHTLFGHLEKVSCKLTNQIERICFEKTIISFRSSAHITSILHNVNFALKINFSTNTYQ